MGIFENFAYGLRYRGVSAGLLRWHNQKNGQFLLSKFENYGAKNCPLKILAPLVDSEFDLDSDFAIKHDPIQLYD